MLRHDSVWAAIDALAAKNHLSASALAKKSGLDPTTFNRSKRRGSDGRPRWPSTESIAKVMQATGSSLNEFFRLLDTIGSRAPETKSQTTAHAPLVGFAQAGKGGFYEDAGFPVGHGWEQVDYPATGNAPTLALQVSGDSMMPLYRDGDTIIMAPDAPVRRGDRVVVRTSAGEVMAKVLERTSEKEMTLASFNPDHANIVLDRTAIEWVARIIWASQ